MSENSTLTIHTQLPPDAPPMPAAVKKRTGIGRRGAKTPSVACGDSSLGEGVFRRRRQGPPPPSQREVAAHGADGGSCQPTALQSEKKSTKRRRRRDVPRPRASFPDRLLRNSAIACAVLLGVLALGNVRQPWAQKAREGIQRALTMRIDLDDSLGELTFVRNLMPESALVFLNVSGGGELSRPMSGAVAHRWSALQPWTLFEGAGEAVRCVGVGTVSAVSPLSGGLYGVLVDHGEGLESVYANLAEVSVSQGDAVNRGDALGTSSEGTYFELREGGESVDPSERLGL